jgi:hypothetical protein
MEFNFADKCVSYATFISDLAATIVRYLKHDASDPEYISQNKAFEMFGRANVERWRKQGKVTPCKRPGKVEYRTADLRYMQRTQQDYFHQKQKQKK